MNITYLECTDKTKLFSFNRHDYKTHTDADGNFNMIDGGGLSDAGYMRYSGGTLKSDTIENLISDIRQQFTWGKNYDKYNNRLPKTEYALLKDLETDHIYGILKYFTNSIAEDQKITLQWKAIHLIFIQELIFRNEQNKEKNK